MSTLGDPSGLGDNIEDYHVLNLLGRGGFACVYRARSISTGLEVGIKMIDKKLMQAAGMVTRVRNEVEIHCQLKHPAVLELYTCFEDSNYVYLVLEMCHNGELGSFLKKQGKVLTEEEARNFMRQIIEGLLYLHSHGIVHRDMTLSNLLLTRTMDVKIADFGLATQLKVPNEKHFTMCGTPNFISPEVVTRKAHGLETDVWSLGCMLYTFLTGSPPFDTDQVRSTLNKVVLGDYHLPQHLSAPARSLITALLRKNPADRPKLADILSHPFMTPADPGRKPVIAGGRRRRPVEASVDSGNATMETVSMGTHAPTHGTLRNKPIHLLPSKLSPLTDRPVFNNKKTSGCEGQRSCHEVQRSCHGEQPLLHDDPRSFQASSSCEPVRSFHENQRSYLGRERSQCDVQRSQGSQGYQGGRSEYNDLSNHYCSSHVQDGSKHGECSHDRKCSCQDEPGGRGPRYGTSENQRSCTCGSRSRCTCDAGVREHVCKARDRHPPSPPVRLKASPSFSFDGGSECPSASTVSHPPTESWVADIGAGLNSRPARGSRRRDPSPGSIPQRDTDADRYAARTNKPEERQTAAYRQHRAEHQQITQTHSSTGEYCTEDNRGRKPLSPHKGSRENVHRDPSDDRRPRHHHEENSRRDGRRQAWDSRTAAEDKSSTTGRRREHGLYKEIPLSQDHYESDKENETKSGDTQRRRDSGRSVQEHQPFQERGSKRGEREDQGHGRREEMSQLKEVRKGQISPLSSKRLRPIRQKTRNAVVSILEDGQVCLEFLKPRDGVEQVAEVHRISTCGQTVIIYQPHRGKGQPLSDRPPSPPQGDDHTYLLHELPSRHKKKYEYAKRFVQLVRSKTPKVTLYTRQAKCMLMENFPQPDFEACFYTGAKIHQSADKTRVIESSGKSYTLEAVGGAEGVAMDTRKMLDHLHEARRRCLDLESAISATENKSGEDSYFPAIISRRPAGAGSEQRKGKGSPRQGGRNSTQGRDVTVGTVTSPSQAPVSASVMSYDGTVLSCAASTVSRVDTRNPPAQTARGRDANSEKRHLAAGLPSASQVVKSTIVQDVGRASQLTSGDIWVQYQDGTQLVVMATSTTVKYVDSSGKLHRYGESATLPAHVRERLVKLPRIVEALAAQKTQTSQASSQARTAIR
ncbi:serine/threonine-protein kinase PLK4-like [Branchiostoma lanceolatum]|uniref:serine/threonine-protein kinase PLK4-like n=1 Tax=Branchiostoma lanceolatum TaxID=7740 RepID=UPI0034534B3B